MHKEARKYGRVTKPIHKKNNCQDKVRVFTKNGGSMEEVLPHNMLIVDKSMTNRACEVTPERQDFGQFTDETDLSQDQYQRLLLEQYGFDPIIPDTISQLKELRKALCGISSPTVENSSQYVNPEEAENLEEILESPEDAWQNVVDEELDQFICKDEIDEVPIRLDAQTICDSPKNIQISEEPRVKVIAEKYSKYKNNNVELRKLVEKIVCMEYDVYDRELEKPVQTMRAYFSLKPACSGKHEERGLEYNPLSRIPSTIKRKFKISEEDLKKLNLKEIEIIDGKIAENQPYLDDLKKVLQQQQAMYRSKHKESLDLRSLYEMARRSSPPFDSTTNLLSKAELMEVKELIIQRCKSAKGIHRQTMETKGPRNEIEGAVSYVTFMDVLRNK